MHDRRGRVWKYRRLATGRLIICATATILAASAIGKPAIAACVGNDVLFSDNFSKPDASWRPTDGAAFRDKRYVVTLQPNGTIIDWPSAFVFDGNYSVCVQVKLPIDPTGAAGSGIAFWVDPEPNPNGTYNYYMAVASPDKYYWVSRVFKGNRSDVVTVAQGDLIKTGANDTNEVSVTLKGNEGTFIINGKEVGKFKGQPPKESYAGITAGSPLDKKYVIEFSDFRVTRP